jgi:hypothetical protein
VRNELEALNNHIFAELERLGNEELTKEEIAVETVRAKSVFEGVFAAVAVHTMSLKAYDMFDGSFGKKKLPAFFRKALAGLEEETNENEKKFPAPLLQFRGDTVPEKFGKGKEHQGIANSL